MTAVLAACFTLSGAAALALEMLWMRSAGLVLGATAATAATVLACYFAGLGIGAALARGGVQQPVRGYALLELGAAAGAVWSAAVFALLGGVAAQRWLGVLGGPGSVAAVALAILPATVCFGASLPVLGQAVVGGGRVGPRSALLYALNTVGGAFGGAAAGFGLPALIGVRATYGLAVAASATAGGLALAARRGPRIEPSRGGAEDASGVERGRLRLVAAGTGALGLALEVLWTRLFAQVLHNSVYSFTAVALVFLVAIAAGAAIAGLLLRRTAGPPVAAAALVLAALATIGGFWVFVRWTDGLRYLGMESGLGEYVTRIVALAAITAGPAALASAIVLPALWAAWGRRDGAARALGDLAAASALGAILGASATGFAVVPTLGVRDGFLLVAASYLILADTLTPAAGRLRVFAYAALLAIVIATPSRAPLVSLRADKETLRAVLEGPAGIVSVVDTGDDLQLRLDNYYVLGGSAAATNQRRLGLVPLLLHEAPRRVAFVGLATGTTASAGPALGVEQTTIVELVPEVAAAARAHFAAWNGGLLDRPGVRLVLDDGRRWLAATPERFDVVVSDLFIPWHASAGNLYAREMYRSVADRLAADGLFCQWLPLYQLTREDFDVIARTFLSVFPEAELWRADFYPDRPVVGLVGRLAPRAVDLEAASERVHRLPAWSRDPLLAAPRGLAMLYVGDLHAVEDLVAHAALNTDDRPLIEFEAPRLTRMTAAGDKNWFTGEQLASFYATLESRLAALPDRVLPVSAEITDARHAGTLLYRYALAATRHDDVTRGRLEAEIRTLVPEVIVAAESDAGTDERVVAGLRREQEDVRRQLDDMERRLSELGGRTP